MVDSLKNYLEGRVDLLQQRLEEHEDAVKNYEQKLVYHKSEINQILDQINEIKTLKLINK